MPRDVAEEITMTVQSTAPSDPPETRAVLVKPGDLLLIGNTGTAALADSDALQAVGELLADTLGIQTVFFAEDIRIDLLPPGAPRA